MTLEPIVLVSLFISCNGKIVSPDAWGNFEATEIIISSETGGRLIQLPVNEGDILTKCELIAVTDTTLFTLQLNELNAQTKSITSRLRTIDAQSEIIRQQIKNLTIDIVRVEKMIKDDAATVKQLDDLNGKVAVLEKQIDANNISASVFGASCSSLLEGPGINSCTSC